MPDPLREHLMYWRILRGIGLAALVGFLSVAFTPVPNLLGRVLARSSRLEPAGAIVVLGGGGVRENGELSDTSMRRTLRGVRLYQQGLAPTIVFSGPRGIRGPAEADVRAGFARTLGVADGAMILESSARTTREESLRIAELLRRRGARRILLVADAEGMRRAGALFERVGLEVLPAPAEDVSGLGGTPEARLALARRVLIEITALAYYHIVGYL